MVHSLANGPEVKKPLLETSRNGYLGAVSASAYSLVSMVAALRAADARRAARSSSLTYMASERVIPGYGGGMSSAKAALESDTRTLAFEAGRKWGVPREHRSPPARSRRARRARSASSRRWWSTCRTNAPLTEQLTADEVGRVAGVPLLAAGERDHGDHGVRGQGLPRDGHGGAGCERREPSWRA